MRILHTADWHIGQRLYERSRLDEHSQFLQWLLSTIQTNSVDVLLVSGDIFDSALPTADATSLYYQFLFQLYNQTDAQAVITAGNHDSRRRLAAAREFLEMGRIHVVGGMDSGPDDCVLTLDSCVGSRSGESVSIAAIPYLSESEVLPHVSFETRSEKTGRYREAMKQLYTDCLANMPVHLPKILMGHLVLQGGEESGSERVIQTGGTSPLHVSDLPEGLDYVALGHLHRLQSIDGADYPIRYSGSPLPMTFKEAEHPKGVCLFDLSRASGVELREVAVPVFKELCRVEGNYDRVMLEAMSGDWAGKYIEVHLILDAPQVGAADRIREAFGNQNGDVLAVELQLSQQCGNPRLSAEEIADKSPIEVFEEFYRAEYGDEKMAESEVVRLLDTFKELTYECSNSD